MAIHTGGPGQGPGSQIPLQFENKKLDSNLSVKTLLSNSTFITQGAAVKMVDWGKLISKEAPTVGLDLLWDRCVLPPAEILEPFLKATLPIDAKSIEDWDEEGKRYPLTAKSIYRLCNRANHLRRVWRAAETWMDRWTLRTKDMSDTTFLTHRLMATLEWDTYIRAVGTSVPTIDLIGMLSDEWLTDSQIDLVLQVLIERTKNEAKDYRVIIAPCVFAGHCSNVYTSRFDNEPLTARLLQRYRDDFLKGRVDKLVFIANVGGTHWVAWMIDYTSGTLSHGKRVCFINCRPY